MNNIQIFENKEFGTIRVVEKDGAIWWVLKDVCNILGIGNPSVVAGRLDEDERAKFDLGRQGETNIINESGLYNVILRSDKPIAKPFKRWIVHEVLPSIRKHGAYMTPETLEAAILNPDTLIQLCNQLKNEMEKNHQLEAKVKHDKPKVLFAEAVSTSKTSILIGELAKILKQNGIDTGEKRLFQWLRDNGYLIRRKGTDYNAPTQRSMDLGLFEVKETAVTHSDGHVSVNKTTKVTGKGQQYFINLFMEKKAG